MFGPAEDGGYVLVGLARRIDAFTGVPWSTPDTMAATRAKIAAVGATWEELPTLWDVDEPRDLARWQALGAAYESVASGQCTLAPRALKQAFRDGTPPL